MAQSAPRQLTKIFKDVFYLFTRQLEIISTDKGWLLNAPVLMVVSCEVCNRVGPELVSGQRLAHQRDELNLW